MSVEEQVQIAAVLVSYNTREMTLECLRSLHREIESADVSAEVFVVDNASTDDSVKAIRENFPHVEVLVAEENQGFGRANNRAFEVARGHWLLLLNTDAFLRPGALQALLDAAKRHPEAGVIAPRILNADGTLQRSCWEFPTPPGAWFENSGVASLLRALRLRQDFANWPHDDEREVEWAIGACLMVRRDVYARVGGFDEQFWMYSEETDWQKRIRDAGWKVVFTPHALVTHLGGGSGGEFIKSAMWESLDRYLLKHHGRGGVLSARAAMVWGNALRLPLWALLSGVFPRRPDFRRKRRISAFLLRRQVGRLPSNPS